MTMPIIENDNNDDDNDDDSLLDLAETYDSVQEDKEIMYNIMEYQGYIN